MDLSTLPKVLVNFLSYKLNIQGCSALTVKEYSADLCDFLSYALSKAQGKPKEEVDLNEIDVDFVANLSTDTVYSYLLYLAEVRKNKPATRAKRLSAIKSFYKYYTSKKLEFENDPSKNIDAPKLQKSLPKFLSLNQSTELLNSLDRNDPNYERNYCIMIMFLSCGMRLSELVGINLSDVDSELERLTVTGKGNKMRTLYLNDACKAALKQYLKVRESKARENNRIIKDKNALFLSKKGNRISQKTVQWFVKKQFELCGMKDMGFSVHKLRHTAATLMHNQGKVDVRVLQEILGHEQLNTTQIYTHVTSEGLKKATAANPLASFKPDRSAELRSVKGSAEKRETVGEIDPTENLKGTENEDQ